MTKKIIFSVLGFLVLAVVGCFIGLNWTAIKTLMSGAQIYTKSQIEESYNQGYQDANTNEETYITQLDYYRNLVEDNELEITNFKNQITNLTNSNNKYINQVETLNSTIKTNEETIENLQLTIDANNSSIDSLNIEIDNLNTEITSLENDIAKLENDLVLSGESNTALQNEINNKKNQIISLNNQVANMQTLVNQLNNTNELNLNTINNLNSQIQALNSEISDLKLQINTNDTNVADLNNKIVELEKSVAYYEQYISNLETETQVVATFEFDGSVYNIQILNKNSYASVVNPVSTDYIIFNGWSVDGQTIDLTNYLITENTKFVADITYKYDVKFMVDNNTFDSQIIIKNGLVSIPTTPTKDNYSFDGWSIDGVNIVDLSSYTITANTTFTALFTRMYNVNFIYEDETLSTQSIKNGAYAQSINVESTTYKVFNGWTVNGTSVDIATYKISADTVFVADITYKYDVIFKVDDAVYNSQVITAGQYATIPTNPTKEDYEFIGWSIDSENIVDISTITISSDTSFIAMFEKSSGGLYDSTTGEKVMTWKQLLNNDYLVMSDDGTLSAGTNVTALSGDLELSDEVVSISDSTFRNCTNLYSVIFTNNIKKIGGSAFYGCTNLISAVIPNSVTSLGTYAFMNCSNLISISTPMLSTAIFQNCINLKDIEFTKDITSIPSQAFYGCSSIKEFEIPNTVTTIGANSLNSTGITSIIIPSSVITLGSGVVSYCSYLESVYYNAPSIKDFTSSGGFLGLSAGKSGNGITIYIGDSVQKIPAYFAYVSSSTYRPNVVALVFGENSICTSIGTSAFAYLGLTTLTIPESVVTLSAGAFSNLGKLTELNYNAIKVTTTYSTSSNPFSNIGLSSQELVINIGDSVTVLPNCLFYGTKYITQINLGAKITYLYGEVIGPSKYTSITLSTIELYQKVTTANGTAYSLLKNPTTIRVLKSACDNSNVYLENKSLYSKTESGDYYVYTKVA